MGTTLTGTTPQDTYDSLIKVTDNGPLSGTAKYLSDGLGNDSALALSTGRVGIGTTTPAVLLDIVGTSSVGVKVTETGGSDARLVAGGSTAFFGTYSNHPLAILTNSSEKMRIDASGNVGIGTSAPSDKLHVSGSGNTATFITGSGCTTYIQSVTNETRIGNLTSGGGSIVFSPVDAERVRITSNGLTFNGDTAAANALDDYEEGTWTMGVAFGGASVGVTYGTNTGTYTKIGRQVTLNGWITLTSKGSSTGTAAITGLPFAVGASNPFYAPASFRLGSMTYTGIVQGYGGTGGTTIPLEDYTEAGTVGDITDADFSNGTNIMVSFTYFV